MDELPTEKVDKYVLELMRGHNDEDGNAAGRERQRRVRPWAVDSSDSRRIQ